MPQTSRLGLFHARRTAPVMITRADGLITIAEAARSCGVKKATVTNWIHRGYRSDAHGGRVFLPVAKTEGRRVFLDPVQVAKAEYATARRARRSRSYG
jgi:hypothetical protein